MTSANPRPVEDFRTVRDWLRFAVTRMTGAKIAFGHGTGNAVDEAAFLILSVLDLPINAIEPWLDCRLSMAERVSIYDAIETRIATRKPAPYVVNAAYIQGRRFYVDERVIVPRSFIGELIAGGGLASLLPADGDVRRVLDLCTGSGCLAILAAEAFSDAHVAASDISTDAIDVARRNVADYGLQNRIALHLADLFDGLPPERFDLIISNPPYVTAAAVNAFPPEYAAEPRLAHLGGDDGLDLVRRILARAAEFLTPGGTLVVEVGQAGPALEAAMPDIDFIWLDTEGSEGEVFMLSAEQLCASDDAPTKKRKKKRR